MTFKQLGLLIKQMNGCKDKKVKKALKVLIHNYSKELLK